MKIILVDDERNNMDAFELETEGLEGIEIMGKFQSPREALEYIKNEPVDLAVLDIAMPEITGIELGQKMRQVQPDILLLYVTAYKEYAFDAFRLDAVDYLLKPFQRADIERALEKAKKLKEKKLVKDQTKNHSIRRIAICDDKKEDCAVSGRAVEKFFCSRGEKISIREYNCAEALLADLEEGYEWFDLIFMDIFMDGMTGIEASHQMREMGVTIPIIFLTISADFAIESYDVQAAGYLLKPLDENKMGSILERVLTPVVRQRIALKCRGEMRYFFVDEITWVESYKHALIIHFTDGNVLQINGKLGDMEQELNDERFLRCHQSYLVNMDYVSDVQEVFIMRDGSRVPIRVRSRKIISDAYHTYFITHTVDKLPKEEFDV
jgi:DNA-binding LytR/AlgR family response regulator